MPPAAPAGGRIGWYADRVDPALASIRLRMLQPLRTLRAFGLPVEEYDPARGAGAYRTLVFTKSLTPAGLALAREAAGHRCRVVYDLCDNLHDGSAGPRREARVALLEQFLRLADTVVFSTPELRRQLLLRHPGLADRSVVIPDALELLDDGGQAMHWAARWQLARLQRFLAGHPGALHCVWFGKSQGRLAGLHHLALAVRHLESLAREHPVTLTVISNRWTRYRAVRSDWNIAHHYLPWSLATFAAALRLHHVAVIPVERNGYTAGKSINRPATAILAGLGVVADGIDSYEELRPWIELDDWQSGLRRYVANPPARDPRLAQARSHLLACYGAMPVAQAWRQLLTDATARQAVA